MMNNEHCHMYTIFLMITVGQPVMGKSLSFSYMKMAISTVKKIFQLNLDTITARHHCKITMS